jgi:hypothetical protein
MAPTVLSLPPSGTSGNCVDIQPDLGEGNQVQWNPAALQARGEILIG